MHFAAAPMPSSADSNDTAPATGLASTPGDYGFSPGERMGRHVVLERIGGGGMGVVYAAYDPKLDRRVALKLLRPDAAGSPEAQARLLREAQTLARLAHPNVVNVHDVGELDGRVFVEMELVKGTTLGEWLAREPRDWRAILDVFLQAGHGLAAAHAVGIVHRDFKPDNVLVGDDGRVRVADFGIALSAEDPAGQGDEGAAAPLDDAETSAPPVVRSLGRDGTSGGSPRRGPHQATPRVGTPAYMAPEQRSAGKTSARSDQYSFCLVLREALSRVPSHQAPPAWLERAVARGLSVTPEERYPSVAALLDVLESEPRRRRRRLRGAAVVAGVGLVAGSAWAGIRSHHQGQALLCSGAEREMSGVWGDAQRRAIAAAFVATRLPYAAMAAAQATSALDRYASDWVAMHGDACEATRVRGEQSDAVMDRRMQCLDRRLAEARTLADVFAKGDAKVVGRAVQASQALSPISDCSAVHARARLGSSRAAVGEKAILEAIGRASALDAAGKFDDSTHAAEGALEGARAAKEASLEAQALELMGRVASQQGDGPRAERLLFDAFVAAGESGDDAVAARAATLSGYSIGYLQNRADEANKWFRLASVAIERLGGDDAMNVRRLYSMSAVAWSAGKFKDAADENREALRISEEKLPGDKLELAYCLTGLGNALMSQGETEEGRVYLERALAVDEQELGPDHPDVEMDLFNVGDVARSDGRYEDARGLYARALAIGERADPKATMVAITHGALAGALMRLGRLDEARGHVESGLAIAQAIDGFEKSRIADLLSVRGIVARLEKRYDDAQRDFERAIEIDTAALGKDNPDASDAMTELARVHLERGQAKKAVPLLERALVLDKDLGASQLAEPRLALAQALWQTGGDRARAAELAKEARAFYERLPARRVEVGEIEDWLAANGGP
jgi:tetratricopeptide (TPR) repeat protein